MSNKCLNHKGIIFKYQIAYSCPFSLLIIFSKINITKNMSIQLLMRLIMKLFCNFCMLQVHQCILSEWTVVLFGRD